MKTTLALWRGRGKVFIYQIFILLALFLFASTLNNNISFSEGHLKFCNFANYSHLLFYFIQNVEAIKTLKQNVINVMGHKNNKLTSRCRVYQFNWHKRNVKMHPLDFLAYYYVITLSLHPSLDQSWLMILKPLSQRSRQGLKNVSYSKRPDLKRPPASNGNVEHCNTVVGQVEKKKDGRRRKTSLPPTIDLSAKWSTVVIHFESDASIPKGQMCVCLFVSVCECVCVSIGKDFVKRGQRKWRPLKEVPLPICPRLSDQPPTPALFHFGSVDSFILKNHKSTSLRVHLSPIQRRKRVTTSSQRGEVIKSFHLQSSVGIFGVNHQYKAATLDCGMTK